MTKILSLPKTVFNSKATPILSGTGVIAGIGIGALGPVLFFFAGVNVVPMALLAGGGGALALTSLATAGAWTTMKIVRHIKKGIGNEKQIRSFLSTNPNIQQIDNFKYSNGDTLLIKAIACGSTDLVDELLMAGANPDIANKLGVTPLQVACLFGNLEIVKRLTEANANVNAVDSTKCTALHGAALRLAHFDTDEEIESAKAIIAYLIEMGADINAQNDDGQTPADMVEEQEYKDLFA